MPTRIEVVLLLFSLFGGMGIAAEFYVPEGFSDNGFVLYSNLLAGKGPTVIGPSSTHIASVRWTTDGDTIDIEHSLGEYRAAAHAASIDLGVVFGSISSVDGNDGNLFRWTKDDGMMDLGNAARVRQRTLVEYFCVRRDA